MSTLTDDSAFEDEFESDRDYRKVDLGLWKRLASHALVYQREMIWMALSAISVGVAEVAFPLITRAVIDDLASQPEQFDLLYYSLLYGAFVVMLAVGVTGFIWTAGTLRTHISHDIRRDGFANLQALSFAYYDFRPVGWLMARMTSDCERLSNILAWGMMDLILSLTMMLGIAGAMLYMDLTLGLIILTVLPLLAWLSNYFQKRILLSARAVRRNNSRITGAFNEGIMGVQTSKAFVKEADNLQGFAGLTSDMYIASVLNKVQAALYLPLVLSLGALATGLALVFGGMEVVWGTITTGTLLAFLAYSRQFFEPIEQLAHWFAEMQMAQASAERIVSLIQATSDVRDSDAVRQRLGQQHPPGIAADGYAADIKQIEFRDVSFAYKTGPRVLNNINLDIKQGESIAIVGSTGGGKSSLINLLCRFYEPTEGTIAIDGVDYRERSLDWLQSNLGMVLQSSHIFGGSISDNIRYGRLDASDSDVIEAARQAGAHDLIMAMEQGYATHVGEGGAKLSAGEKQLVSFARAILANPQILIMDEATSCVDTQTEAVIQKGLQALLAGRISLVIAHRLSTIRHADRILVMEQGCIAEAGSHAELMAVQGRYHKLYTQQSLAEFRTTAWQTDSTT